MVTGEELDGVWIDAATKEVSQVVGECARAHRTVGSNSTWRCMLSRASHGVGLFHHYPGSFGWGIE